MFQNAARTSERKKAKSTYDDGRLSNILSSAVKEDGLVKTWRKRELENKRHQQKCIITKLRSRSIGYSPTLKL